MHQLVPLRLHSKQGPRLDSFIKSREIYCKLWNHHRTNLDSEVVSDTQGKPLEADILVDRARVVTVRNN